MLSVLPTECDCEMCSSMCHAPCSGTPAEMVNLMKAGYANRLMCDNIPDESGIPEIIKPALKGYEGKSAPYTISSRRGCTFFKEGKCELHDLGLKPIQGKLAHHNNNEDQIKEINLLLIFSWNSEGVDEAVNLWKKLNPAWQEDSD